MPIFGIGIQGRQGTCPLIQRDPDLRVGNPEELSKLCADRKARSIQGKDGGCRFYEATMKMDMREVEDYARRELPTVEEFSAWCDKKGLCPHELTKDLMPFAQVVTAPYIYFFMPFIRSNLLDWMNVPLSDTVVIVDEAHNLPDYAREIRSVKLSMKLLDLVEKEVDEFGDPELINGISIRDVSEVVKGRIKAALDEYLIDDDGLIPVSFLEEGLMTAFRTTTSALSSVAKGLLAQGESIREAKKKAGQLPRSYIYTFRMIP